MLSIGVYTFTAWSFSIWFVLTWRPPILISLSNFKVVTPHFYFLPTRPHHNPHENSRLQCQIDTTSQRYVLLIYNYHCRQSNDFKRMWSASQRGLNVLDMIAIPPSLLSAIATVAYTKAKLERIMGFCLLCPPSLRDQMHFHQVRSPFSIQFNLMSHPLCPARFILNTTT